MNTPKASSNGAPVPAAASVGQPLPSGSNGAALQDEITDSFATTHDSPKESSMRDSGVARSELKLRILNSVAGIHPHDLVASTRAGHTGTSTALRISIHCHSCRHGSWCFCHPVQASESSTVDRGAVCHEPDTRSLYRTRRQN